MITGSARFDLETQHVDVAKEPVMSLPLLGGVEKVGWLILGPTTRIYLCPLKNLAQL